VRKKVYRRDFPPPLMIRVVSTGALSRYFVVVAAFRDHSAWYGRPKTWGDGDGDIYTLENTIQDASSAPSFPSHGRSCERRNGVQLAATSRLDEIRARSPAYVLACAWRSLHPPTLYVWQAASGVRIPLQAPIDCACQPSR
jgi:hypothetical protein